MKQGGAASRGVSYTCLVGLCVRAGVWWLSRVVQFVTACLLFVQNPHCLYTVSCVCALGRTPAAPHVCVVFFIFTYEVHRSSVRSTCVTDVFINSPARPVRSREDLLSYQYRASVHKYTRSSWSRSSKYIDKIHPGESGLY